MTTETPSRSQAVDNGAARLHEILLDEMSLYTDLGEAMRGKQNAIIAGDLNALTVETAREQDLVRRCGAATERRAALLAEAFRACGVPSEPLSLNRFIDLLDAGEAALWRQIDRSIRSLAQSLQRINRENVRLLQSSLKLNRSMLSVLFPEGKEGTYDKSGTVKKAVRGRDVLNRRI